MTLTTSAPATPDRAARPDRRPWFMLAVLLLGQFMALLDVTVVNVAMTDIRGDLHASGAALQLVVSGYTVGYAMLLITGARLGELFGRRRLFVTGTIAFTVCSLLCGLAPDPVTLIAARIAQGAGAALMMPQVISLIQAQFSGAARAKALSAYTAVISVAFVAGQVLGGVLVGANLFGTGWRPIFLVNVPIGVLVALLALRLVPGGVAKAGRRLDLAGLAIAVPAVVLVVLPLVLGHEVGWPGWTFGSIAAGVLLAVLFVVVERRVRDPLVDLGVLRIRGVAPGLATLAAGVASYGGFLFCVSLHLQSGLGKTAMAAGLAMAPGGIVFGLCGFFWNRLPQRVHAWLTPCGYVGSAVAYALLALDGDGGTLFFVALLLFGLSMGPAFGSLMAQALTHVPVERASDVSGLLTTTLQLGQVIGVATFGSVFLTLATASSAHAITTTMTWAAVLLLAGSGFAVVLACASVRR
ncbi:MFS transporter [Amycolatopsis mongoliensis]|uniref:MFS transporter n=1 Tax=Amycolatopsis mongoliensis TaxID=715475 RepID=A0A9Y2JUS6_9PSEU|nr:MFS transporter [Amycolatopsis sp. 4-36]WIY04598.1 MFS transporter [Amycolatopsis sp. 4-36]